MGLASGLPGVETAPIVWGIGQQTMGSQQRPGSSEKLLRLFVKFADRSRPWTVDELSRDLDLAQSTTYRYLKSLADAGMVVAVSAGSYILGPTVIMLDRQMRLSDPLILGAEATLDRLHDTLGIPSVVLVCRLFRGSVMCVDSRQIGEPNIKVSYARGRPLPLYRGAVSKVILANMQLRAVRGFFDADPQAFADAGIGTDWTEIKRYLRGVRRAEVLSTSSEVDHEVRGIASPIVDANDQVIGSLGFVAPNGDVDEAQQERLKKIIAASAKEICAEIRRRDQPDKT